MQKITFLLRISLGPAAPLQQYCRLIYKMIIFQQYFIIRISFFEDKKIVSQSNMHRLNRDELSIHKFMLKPK